MTTMQCADIKALLSGLVDDAVDPETRHLAEQHLGSCRPCRALIDEAESLDRLLTLDGEGFAGGLPADFEDAVLDRINAPIPFVAQPRRLTTWLGWVAAAASLGLAVTIWVMDRRDFLQPQPTQVAQAPTGGTVEPTPPAPIVTDYPGVRNATYTRPIFGNHMAPAYDSLLSPGASDEPSPPFSTSSTDQEPDAKAAARSRALSALSDQPHLSDDDALTLYSASILLSMIAESDATSFQDLEAARQIAVYDELLPRLAKTRMRLPLEDRPLIFAAESILTRVVGGTLELQDLRDMRDTIVRLGLSTRVETLSDRGGSA